MTKSNFLRQLMDDPSLWLFILFLTLLFATSGSSRNDVQSLVILQPTVILFFGLAIWRANQAQLMHGRLLLLGMALFIMVTLLYMIPLPVSVWSALPGRSLIADIDRSAGLNDVIRSAAIDPARAQGAFIALLVPLTAMLLLLQITPEGRYRILPALIALGLFSGFIGVLQSISDPQGSLYFYRLTNHGSAVGVFANRNHQAILLAMLFPMLAAFVAVRKPSKHRADFRSLFSVSIGALLVPLLLVTGSRSGILLGVVGLACALMIYMFASAKVERVSGRSIALLSAGIIALVATTITMSRAQALDRLLGNNESESRVGFWRPIADNAVSNLPMGEGPGGFVSGYAAIEPVHLADKTYLNHAHNDWLEFLSDYGVFAVILTMLFVGAAIFVIRRSIIISSGRRRVFAMLGMSIISIMALASVSDYPLRTSIHAAVLAIALVWLFQPGEEKPKKRQQA